MELKSADLVPDTEEVSTGRDHSRDDFQKGIDAEVKALIDLWHQQGDQEILKGAPSKRYVVATTDRGEMRKVIERAFTLASSGQARKIGPAWYASKVNGDVVALKFVPRYLPEKAPKAEANGNATPEPTQEPQADQGSDTPQATTPAMAAMNQADQAATPKSRGFGRR